MGRVNLCWVCSRCGRDTRVSMDPFEDQEEINWAPDATLCSRCDGCGTPHEIQLCVQVKVDLT